MIVATRPGGLADGDGESLRRLDTDLPGAGVPSPPRMSDDGAAAVVVVPFSGVADDRLVAAVERLRERLTAHAHRRLSPNLRMSSTPVVVALGGKS